MKTLIFDFDGTLADTLDINHQILNRLAKWFRFRQTDVQELKSLKRLPASQILKALEITPLKVPFVTTAGKLLLSYQIDKVQMPQGLLGLLHQLQPKWRFGVVSTNGKGNVKRFLKVQGAPEFDFVHANARILGKASAIEKAIKSQGLNKTDCIYVGDEIRDIEACREVGIACIAVSWGYNVKSALEQAQPDFLVDDVQQLAMCIQRQL